MSRRVPESPANLSGARAALWSETVATYELDPLELELLRLALEALDRVDDARGEIAEHGAFTVDRYGGRRVSPAVAVERDARTAFARLWRELDLDGAPAPTPRTRRR